MGSNLLNYQGPDDDPFGNIAERERLSYERSLRNLQMEEQERQEQEAKAAAVRAAFLRGETPDFSQDFSDVTSGASGGGRYRPDVAPQYSAPRTPIEDDNDPVGVDIKKALSQYLAGVESGASSTVPGASVSRAGNEGMSPVSEPRPTAGTVDVTIDGKTYSYGGGQRGGVNGPAPTLDLQPSGYSLSGYSTKAFGGEADRRGGRPFAVADPSGTGELGAETGASGMVKLSEDSTTPMALELKAQERQRQLGDVLFANRMKLEQELSKDPLFRERELAKIDQQKQEALLGAQGRSATMAYNSAAKMQAIQRAEQDAMEAMQRMEAQYAKDPAALEKAQAVIQQRYIARKQAIEAQYGAT